MNRFKKIVLALLITITIPNAALGTEFTLDIFGNANMDEWIDGKDITYVEGILNNANEETTLSDATQDGKVDQADIDRIQQIIDGTESELYYVDCVGNTSKVKHPLKKIIITYDNTGEIIRILEAKDRVVGVDSGTYSIQSYERYFPEFANLPGIGRDNCDAEKILELEPDALFLGSYDSCPNIESMPKGANIDVVHLETWSEGVPSLIMMAYMLDEVDNAKKYMEWRNGYLDMVQERVADIPLDKRQRVFFDRPGNTTVARGSGYSEAIEAAGGINIAADLTSSLQSDGTINSENTLPQVDTEWVLEQNPDCIIGLSWPGGYEVDDDGVLKTRYDEILGTTGFRDINAGKNKKIYVTYYITTLGPGDHIGVMYYAKWLYPDLFKDLDPQKVHQEYIDKFQHVDFDLDKHGVFVYPPLNES